MSQEAKSHQTFTYDDSYWRGRMSAELMRMPSCYPAFTYDAVPEGQGRPYGQRTSPVYEYCAFGTEPLDSQPTPMDEPHVVVANDPDETNTQPR